MTNIEAAMLSISQDRKRTNILRASEQRTLAFLCRLMPGWVTPNMLTGVSIIGSLIVFGGIWAAKLNVYYLFVAIAGFAVQWFGDSLDGRLAYYRNSPRKWYGFGLDMSMDYVSTILMSLGFYLFMPADLRIYIFLFGLGYGATMVLSLLKYQITGLYSIDNGLFGPTELRVLLCLILLVDIIWPGTINFFAYVVNLGPYPLNIVLFLDVIKQGNKRDKDEHGK